MTAVTLIGSPVSPYVRKVLACCALKGVEVGVDPITPFMGDEAFAAISPLRRIPVWIEGDVTLCDSSVIVQYIEETRPGPSLWPADPVQRARPAGSRSSRTRGCSTCWAGGCSSSWR